MRNLTTKKKINGFDAIKIKLSNESISKQVIDHLIDKGYQWRDKRPLRPGQITPYLYIKNGMITWGISEYWFNEISSHVLMTAEDLLNHILKPC
jgi:hypothetical protein